MAGANKGGRKPEPRKAGFTPTTKSASEIATTWATAATMDRSLRIRPEYIGALRAKRVKARPYSRATMFREMAARRIAIYRGVPVLVRKDRRQDAHSTLVDAFAKKFPPKETSRVQVGPSHTMRRLPVREIMRRWRAGRAVVGVTDLHIRGTRIEEIIDTQALSDFNILIRGSEDMALQEMMTLVIASPGNVTDSHSDDPDGTNHCFIGKKLWLAWDAFEGMQAGLQDVERQDVHGTARFDMARFLSLRSSRWFTVTPGDTLFLPGNFTHKVVTLEYYLGVGSFHVALPNALDTLTRWIYHGALWETADREQADGHLVKEIAAACVRICGQALSASQRQRDRWGLPFVHASYRHWSRTTPRDVRRAVAQDSAFRDLLDLMVAHRPAARDQPGRHERVRRHSAGHPPMHSSA